VKYKYLVVKTKHLFQIDIVLNAKDLRVETCRASGKGGQNINKSQSAVRIVHLPTGKTSTCAAETLQHSLSTVVSMVRQMVMM